MATPYVAYGLQIDSAFRFPGMTPCTQPDLPRLSVALSQGSDPTSTAGPDYPPLWEGRLGDGCCLALRRGSDGQLVFVYGDRARYVLSSDLCSLICRPLRSGLHWQRILLSKVLAIVSVIRGHEALHAAAVDSPSGVVAILAPSGAGKTTTALELMRHGWPLFTDDILTLKVRDGRVLAYPGTPHMNVIQSARDAITPEQQAQELGWLAGERWLALRSHTSGPRPVRLICIIERRRRESLACRQLSPSPLVLVPYHLGVFDSPTRQRGRFKLYGELTASTALVALRFGQDDPPVAVAETIVRALEHAPTATLACG